MVVLGDHVFCRWVVWGGSAMCPYYRLLKSVLFMIPLGTSIGLTVRMGHVIADDPGKAKRMAAWTMVLIVIVAASVALCLHSFQLPIIRLFSNDPDVIHDSKAIWSNVCYYIFVLYVFGINGAIHCGT